MEPVWQVNASLHTFTIDKQNKLAVNNKHELICDLYLFVHRLGAWILLLQNFLFIVSWTTVAISVSVSPDENKRYVFPQVWPGRYDLKINKHCFEELTYQTLGLA